MWTIFYFSIWISGHAEAAGCFNHCQLVRIANSDEYSLHCNCSRKSAFGERDWMAQKKSPERREFLRQRFIGLDLSRYPEVVENSCRSKLKVDDPSNVKKKRELAKLPICECVSNQMQIRKQKNCRLTAAGERLCQIQSNNEGVHSKPLNPDLYSYQICMMNSETYERPSRCPASPCSASVPTCGTGEALYNLADPEGCCPVFVCQKVEEKIL